MNSANVKLTCKVGDSVVYTAKSGTTYSAKITAITRFGVAIHAATGQRFFEEKCNANARIRVIPPGAVFFAIS